MLSGLPQTYGIIFSGGSVGGIYTKLLRLVSSMRAKHILPVTQFAKIGLVKNMRTLYAMNVSAAIPNTAITPDAILAQRKRSKFSNLLSSLVMLFSFTTIVFIQFLRFRCWSNTTIIMYTCQI